MHRFVASYIKDCLLYIQGREVRHLRAKRIKPGDEIQAWLNNNVYICRVESIDKQVALCSVIGEIKYSMPKPYVYVYQCVPKDIKEMDEIVENLSQVGAYALIPVISNRSFRDYDTIFNKRSRWERVALASFKQCMRPEPLVLEDPVFIENLVPKHSLNLLLDNFHEGTHIKNIVFGQHDCIGVVVGPEGGFTSDEVSLLIERGFSLLSLKPYIIKSKFVASVLVGIIMNLA